MLSISDNTKKSKALLVGINYIHSDNNIRLYGCINDAKHMQDVLQTNYGIENDDIIILVDDDDDENKWPTKHNIEQSLHKLIDESENLSDIWIHYSGHGSYIDDIDGDEKDGKDEVLIPCDYRKNGVIVDDYFFNILNDCKCPVFLTIDCCHSGSMSDLTYSFTPYGNRRFIRKIERKEVMENRNLYMLSGCRDDQTSADVNYGEKYEGAFTRALIDSLKMYNYSCKLTTLYIQVLNLLKNRNHTQRTIMSSSNPYPNISIKGNTLKE